MLNLDELFPPTPLAHYATWERYTADCGEYTLDLLIAPGTDLDGNFRAFDREAGAMIRVNGWLCSFNRA